jgi:hypothetical protein
LCDPDINPAPGGLPLHGQKVAGQKTTESGEMDERDRLARPLIEEYEAWLKRNKIGYRKRSDGLPGVEFDRELTPEEHEWHRNFQSRWEATVPDTDENAGSEADAALPRDSIQHEMKTMAKEERRGSSRKTGRTAAGMGTLERWYRETDPKESAKYTIDDIKKRFGDQVSWEDATAMYNRIQRNTAGMGWGPKLPEAK